MSKRLVFFGSEEFSIPTLQKLIDEKYDIEAVVTKPDSRSGRGKKLSSPKVKQIADRVDIPVLQPESKEELAKIANDLDSEIAVLVSYGMILPGSVLKHFIKGVVNLHPSLLPAHRGPSPIESAILAGDKKFGVTIMQLDSGMDTGPVFSTGSLFFDSPPTRLEFIKKASEDGAEYLVSDLPDIIKGKLSAAPQKSDGVSVTKLIKKSDGKIDFTLYTATEIERQIRAYLGWPGSFLYILGKRIIITSAKTIDDKSICNIDTDSDYIVSEDDQLFYRCKNNTIIEITSLKPEGKSEMLTSDFIRGLKN